MRAKKRDGPYGVQHHPIRQPPRSLLVGATLLLLAFGCSGDGSTDPDPSPPGTMTAASATDISGTVGQPVAGPPTVRVVDEEGNPLGGVSVTFAAASGGGSVVEPVVVTNPQGLATVGSWTLGTSAGENTLTASAESLSDVTFTATAAPGPPASVQKSAGDEQSVLASSLVPVAPSVTVLDEYENPVPEADVTFSVTEGGGSVTGADQTTDPEGVATVESWRLGLAPGPNALAATVGSITAEFSATGEPCPVEPLALGDAVDGELDPSDCFYLDGEPLDWYGIDVPDDMAVELQVDSDDFDSHLALYTGSWKLVAVDDTSNDSPTPDHSYVKVLVTEGPFLAGASAQTVDATGDYTLSTGATSPSVDDCEEAFIMGDLSTEQSLDDSDCVFPDDDFYYDAYWIWMDPDETLTVTMTSNAVDSYLILTTDASATGSYETVDENDDMHDETLDAQVTYTTDAEGWFRIWASSFLPEEVGAYILTVTSEFPTADPESAPQAGETDRRRSPAAPVTSRHPSCHSARAPGSC